MRAHVMSDSETKLIFRNDHDRVEVDEYPFAHIATYSNPRPESALNEDACAIIPVKNGGIVLAVADGAGGMRQGHLAAATAINALVETLGRVETTSLDLRGYIIDAFELANQRILSDLNGSATTLAVVEIVGDRVRPYHVGDSMILLTGQKGLIKYRSTAHSPVGYALQSGLVNEKEAMQDEESHVVYNLVGTKDMSIEVGPPMSMAPRDTLIIASDGLRDNLPLETIVEGIRAGNLEKNCLKLMQQCRKVMLQGSNVVEGHPDDLTAIVFRPRLVKRKKAHSTKGVKVA